MLLGTLASLPHVLARLDAAALAWFKGAVPLGWPVLILIVVLTFRGPLHDLIDRIQHIKGPGGLEVWVDGLAQANDSAERTEVVAEASTDVEVNVEAAIESHADATPAWSSAGDDESVPTLEEIEAATRVREDQLRPGMERRGSATWRGDYLRRHPEQLRGPVRDIHPESSEAAELERRLPPTTFTDWAIEARVKRLDNPAYAVLSGYDAFLRWLERYLAARWPEGAAWTDPPHGRDLIFTDMIGLVSATSIEGLRSLSRLRDAVAHEGFKPTAAMAEDYLDTADRLSRAIEAAGPSPLRALAPDVRPGVY